jgi:hypothetical protein
MSMEDLLRFAKDAIVHYVEARPESADTLEGIHHWWIQWPGAAESMAVTLAALEQLERDGLMQGIRVGNRDIWRRRRPDTAHAG